MNDEPVVQPLLQPDVESMSGALPRQDLVDVLGRSAGEFLGRIGIDAETQGERFVGWRITELPASTPEWLDVRVGDVVTSINGLAVERPEDAQQIWEVLQIASEVRIDLTRGDERRSVRVPVADGETDPPVDPELEPDPRGPEE